MKTRISYQQSVTSGQPMPLTIEKWNELIDSPQVANICRRIAALDPTAEDYNDRKQALKKRLPIIIPHAKSFANNKRISADATPSGLAMLDVDHVDNPRAWFESLNAKRQPHRLRCHHRLRQRSPHHRRTPAERSYRSRTTPYGASTGNKGVRRRHQRSLAGLIHRSAFLHPLDGYHRTLRRKRFFFCYVGYHPTISAPASFIIERSGSFHHSIIGIPRHSLCRHRAAIDALHRRCRRSRPRRT